MYIYDKYNMKTRDNVSTVLRRLEGLESKVSELQSLVERLVKWTDFQVFQEGGGERLDGKGGEGVRDDKKTEDDDDKSQRDTSDIGTTESTRGKGRIRIGPKSRMRKKTAVNENVEMESVSGDLAATPRRTCVVARKSTSGVPKCSASLTDVSESFNAPATILDVSIKDEPVDTEFIICPSSPAASVGGTSFVLEIQGEKDQDSTDIRNDNDYDEDEAFLFHTSSDEEDDNDEEMDSGDEEIMHADESGDDYQEKKTSKRKRRGGRKSKYSKDNPKPKRVYRYRGPKVIVQPLSSRTKPPFVRLNRIDGVTLKEKFGIEEPGPRVPKVHHCPRCDEKFAKLRDMWIHKMQTHPKVYKRYTCEFCQKVHASKTKHSDHVNTHTGARPHLCELCGYASGSRNALKSHIKFIHVETEKKLQCEVCAEMLKTKSSLKVHMKLKHTELGDNQLYPCDECGAVFKLQDKLQRHKKEIHQKGRRFQCPMCDKSFKRPSHLAAHKARHDAGIKRKRMLKDEYDKRKKAATTATTRDETKSEAESAVEAILPDADPLYIGVAEEDILSLEEQETQKLSQLEPELPSTIPSTNSDIVQEKHKIDE